nr:unnamed protein product [Salmo salar]|eukprot:XP_013999121.1 PREDICTED: low density lipoprotein receptor adapter protein 1-like [Salmo salar]
MTGQRTAPYTVALDLWEIAQEVLTLTVAQAFTVALDLWEIAQENKSQKARTCCSCSVTDGQTENTNTHSVSDSEKQQPLRKEEKLRRPFFSMSFSSPSPSNKPTRKRPIKHGSWDVEDGLDDAFSSSMEVEEMDTV